MDLKPLHLTMDLCDSASPLTPSSNFSSFLWKHSRNFSTGERLSFYIITTKEIGRENKTNPQKNETELITMGVLDLGFE